MKITVIVAAKNASSMIKESLTAWKNQLHNTDEIIVSNASDESTAEIVRREFPSAILLNLDKNALIPELWAAAIPQSTGELIAITIANCVPRSTWIKHARILIASGLSGAGGAIENHRQASLADTAVYFSRYWRYLPPFIAKETDDLPADNVVYKTSDLLKYRMLFKDGFWDHEINKQMIEEGMHLLITPNLTASHKYGAGFFSFFANRFHHGFHFGRARCEEFGIPKRILYVLAAPVIPFVLLYRIWNATKVDTRQRRSLTRVVPLLLPFLIAWSIGEVFGYIAGPLQA